MEASEQPSSSLPAPAQPSKRTVKNQKKKQRQKLSKKFKALLATAGQAQDGAVPGSHPKPCSVAAASPGSQPPAELQPPAKRAKHQHGPAPKLSVNTLPQLDRPASRAGEQPAVAAPAAAAIPSPCPQPVPAATAPLAQQPAEMQRRVDLSHAAALIHAQLLGAVPAVPSPSGQAAGTAQPCWSPAASGCCEAAGVGGAALLAGAGAVAAATYCQQAVMTSSTVTSTLTLASSGAAAGPAPGNGAAVAGGGQWQSHALALRGGDAAVRGGLMDSDAEEEEQEREDFGDAVSGSGGEDSGPAAEAGGQGGAAAVAAGQQGGAGGPERRQRRVYVFGNYHRYYGYRLGQAFREDPRLQCFERGWFANRRCLDVGCNEGVVTLAIAARFGTKSMMGVDIDEHLVRRACMHLREERTRAAARAVEVRRGGTAPAERRAAHAAHAALSQTWFVHADFVDSEGEPGSFDTITCLSVAKWVHLNRGDAGLEALLAKFWRLLAPGGLLVLEPQPWKSYKAAAAKMRKQPVSDSTFFHRLGELALRPEALPDLLVDRLGFRLIKRLHPPSATAAGFDRPMYLFRKPAH